MSTVISVRVTEKEKVLAEKLAGYLHARGSIEKPTVSEAMRLTLYFTVGEITKNIEAERLGGKGKSK